MHCTEIRVSVNNNRPNGSPSPGTISAPTSSPWGSPLPHSLSDTRVTHTSGHSVARVVVPSSLRLGFPFCPVTLSTCSGASVTLVSVRSLTRASTDLGAVMTESYGSSFVPDTSDVANSCLQMFSLGS